MLLALGQSDVHDQFLALRAERVALDVAHQGDRCSSPCTGKSLKRPSQTACGQLFGGEGLGWSTSLLFDEQPGEVLTELCGSQEVIPGCSPKQDGDAGCAFSASWRPQHGLQRHAGAGRQSGPVSGMLCGFPIVPA